MNRNAQFLPALVAILVLGGVAMQTAEALRRAGPWRTARSSAGAPVTDPYARLDRMLAQSHDTTTFASTSRDPFGYGAVASGPIRPARPVERRPPAPPAPPMPVLTAIVSDADPRAVIRYDGRNYTVSAGGLFADFQVIDVTAEAVVLERNGQRLVLQRPVQKGE